MSYPKPKVCKIGPVGWAASITRGFAGNYEQDLKLFWNWRDAFDWAFGQVRDWDPSLRDR